MTSLTNNLDMFSIITSNYGPCDQSTDPLYSISYLGEVISYSLIFMGQYLCSLHSLCFNRSKTVQFWSSITFTHWNYGFNHPGDKNVLYRSDCLMSIQRKLVHSAKILMADIIYTKHWTGVWKTHRSTMFALSLP